MKFLITFLMFATCLNNGVRLQVAPSVSPGVLLDLFVDIENTLGVFPDRPDNSSRLYIATQDGRLCMNIYYGIEGSGVPVVSYYCGSDNNNDRFTLHHIGDGYISIASPTQSCIGVGPDEYNVAVTGDWCDSVSHQFALTREDDHALFVNRESGLCLRGLHEVSYPADVVPCNSGDADVHWLLCKDPELTLCWPPPSQADSPIKKSAAFPQIQIRRPHH